MNNNEFTALVYSQKSNLMAHAMRFTRDVEDANDLIQDTLMKAFRFSGQFEQGSNLKGWLFVIMKNTFINNYRKNAARTSIIFTEEEIGSDQLKLSATRNKAEGKFLMEEIQHALQALPELYRVPFIRYFEGYKYHEIAEELGIPLGTVKTHIHQARMILKKRLKNHQLRSGGVN